jgi:hypothetical protein
MFPKNVDARKVKRSNFHGEGPQILGATLQIPVSTQTWGPNFVHPCLYKCNYGCQEWILLFRNKAILAGAFCGCVCLSALFCAGVIVTEIWSAVGDQFCNCIGK